MSEIGKYYKYSYKGNKIDVYRILKIFNIVEPAQQHAIKKLLRAGKSIKNLTQDIDEVIDSLQRWKEMIVEDYGTDTKLYTIIPNGTMIGRNDSTPIATPIKPSIAALSGAPLYQIPTPINLVKEKF